MNLCVTLLFNYVIRFVKSFSFREKSSLLINIHSLCVISNMYSEVRTVRIERGIRLYFCVVIKIDIVAFLTIFLRL